MKRFTWIVSAATSLSVLLWPSYSALASAEAGEAAGEKPSLMHWDFGAALWSMAVFVALLTILRRFAWKPILQGLNQREEFIRDSLASAKREREVSERLLKEYTEMIHHAREEATAIVEEGRRDAEEVRKRIHGEAKKEADAMIARAKREIEIARDDAVKQLHDQSVILATEIAGRMIRRQLQPQDHQKLLDESLQELERMSA
jgi:F-type H+-transporting ATPase subunit b